MSAETERVYLFRPYGFAAAAHPWASKRSYFANNCVLFRFLLFCSVFLRFSNCIRSSRRGVCMEIESWNCIINYVHKTPVCTTTATTLLSVILLQSRRASFYRTTWQNQWIHLWVWDLSAFLLFANQKTSSHWSWRQRKGNMYSKKLPRKIEHRSKTMNLFFAESQNNFVDSIYHFRQRDIGEETHAQSLNQ